MDEFEFERVDVCISGKFVGSAVRIGRPDVKAAYGHVPHAMNSGFSFSGYCQDIGQDLAISIVGINKNAPHAKIEKFVHSFANADQKDQKEDRDSYWDKNVKIHDNLAGIISWLHSPLVQKYGLPLLRVNEKLNPFNEWLSFVKQKYVPNQLSYGLSLGCGDGTLERHAILLKICGRFDAYDNSPKSIEIAKALAAREKIDEISYRASDINNITLDKGKYDIVFVGSAMHHFSNLEHVTDEIRNSLKPQGLFVMNEFIGPSQFQWTDKQLRIMNDLLHILPARLRIDKTTGSIKGEIVRASVDYMNQHDPSEAIRSAEIVSVVSRSFRQIERVDFGGTLLHRLLHGIVSNFDPAKSEDIAILKLLIYTEQLLIRENVIPSDFAFFVMSPQ